MRKPWAHGALPGPQRGLRKNPAGRRIRHARARALPKDNNATTAHKSNSVSLSSAAANNIGPTNSLVFAFEGASVIEAGPLDEFDRPPRVGCRVARQPHLSVRAFGQTSAQFMICDVWDYEMRS
jgi:hypothetical protein